MMTTATATETDLSPRLLLIFAQAGLISEEDLRKHVANNRKHKNVIELLHPTQDISIRWLGELLNADIPLPFRRGRRLEIADQLTSLTDFQSDELIDMLKSVKPRVDHLIARLDEAGTVDGKELMNAVEKAKEMDADPYEWLVRHDLLSPDVVKRFLDSPDNPLSQRCALFIVLSILAHNNVISSTDCDRLSKKVYGDPIESTIAVIKETAELTSAGLIEKIEAGLYLPEVSLDDVALDPELLGVFPTGLVRRQAFFPISQDKHRIQVAIADPLNTHLAVLIRWVTGKWMQPFFSPSGTLLDQINVFYGPAIEEELLPESQRGADAEIDRALVTGIEAGPLPVEPPPRPDEKQRKAARKSPAKRPARPKTTDKKTKEKNVEVAAPIKTRPVEAPADSLSAVQLVSSLIESALELRATDIHLEPLRNEMSVRLRIDGQMTKILNIPRDLVAPVTSRIKVLASMDVTERRRPQDGHIMLDMDTRHIDLRIATMPTVFGEKVAIRILDSQRVMSGLADLGFGAKQLKVAQRLIHRPHGITLVVGPTGSGKTSTLYSALNEINDEHQHLVTIEDPVEYQLDGINQVQVDTNIGLTFSEGLRAILRQDPNVIMIGEIRDPDTAKTAIRAALTGHLVFSTLHTNSALGAFQALGNLEASPYMIGSAITGVISQRLVRMLCAKCKKTKPVSKALAAQLGLTYSTKLRLARAVGCNECLGTGYSGRTGIFEVIEVTSKLRNAVMANESPARLLEVADSDGRQSIQQAGVDKVKAGITSPEELVEKVILDS